MAEALELAVKVRNKYELGIASPISVFDVADEIGISVRFVDINMEGLYVREPRPRIIVSALRPLPRRIFTCAHELGHHFFGHGSNLDLLIAEDHEVSPEEVQANSFATFLLLPSLGIRRAFVSRNWNSQNPSPIQIQTIANDFGVGYSTLIRYLQYTTQTLTNVRAKQLLRSTPQQIKEELTGIVNPGAMVVVDKFWQSKTVDVELGTFIVLPTGVLPANERLVPVLESACHNVFVAQGAGLVRIIDERDGWAKFVRIMPAAFVGMATYRHLDEGE